MTQDLTAVLDQLSAHEAKLALELDELSSKAKKVHDKLTQVRTALAALNGVPIEHTSYNNKKQKKNPANLAAIEGMIRELIADKKSVSIDSLFDSVKSGILARGLSRIGLKRVFNKALTHPTFAIDLNREVSLKK